MRNAIGVAPGRNDVLQNLQLRAAEIWRGEGLRLLEKLVQMESPSDHKSSVDSCAGLVAEQCESLGAHVRLLRQREFGDLVVARFGRKSRVARPSLLLGHTDTVWSLGTLAELPFAVRDGRVFGPGVLDMKAGVAMALIALRILEERKLLTRPVILLLNSDEEVGSPVSRMVTEKLAREADRVFVLEPAQGLEGAYKTSRKGIGNFSIHVQGIAAHSGVDFTHGHSAVLELARQIERISGFTDLERGITVNPGVIGGGTRSNVVPAHAWTEVDLRVAKASDAPRMERKFKGLRPIDRKCVLKIEGGMNRPPMERSKGTVTLFRKAATFAAMLGFDLKEASTGGGSDGNFTAALGVPTLDGMGAVGEGAHARHESVVFEHLAPRTALLAAMMME